MAVADGHPSPSSSPRPVACDAFTIVSFSTVAHDAPRFPTPQARHRRSRDPDRRSPTAKAPSRRPCACEDQLLSAPKKVVLAVIDGARPAMVERAIELGRAPSLASLVERGSYVADAVAVFPSVTPVCAAAIATGLAQDRHHIPSMNWYDRIERRYVEYGSSFRAALRFGLAQQLTDTIYNMNGAHLAPDALTVFEQLDDAELRTAGTTYLMYRGRHRQEPAHDTLLARLAALSLVRRAVLGPRELFYADIFASRDTGCRSTLGMPGVRDRHAGCVGAYLVEHDLFDFLLLSLPDNDNHSHRHGPENQLASIAAADRQLAKLYMAGGGTERFLREHAVIVVADHAHTLVEHAISLNAEFGADFAVLAPADAGRETGAEIALCPAQRAAMIYILAPGRLDAVIARARTIAGVEHVIWREGEHGVIAAGGDELRFAPDGDVADRRGRRWQISGDLAVLDAVIDGDVIHCESYPDAIGRAWDALACPTSGEVLLSAADGFEFTDWGGADHVGGGSHGSLSAGDSFAPLICCGIENRVEREQWSIKDVTPLITGHFGLQ
jgi:hypothetical protein